MAEIKIKERVLMVDDEPNVLAGYVRHLRKGLNVDTALGGERALELLASQGPYAVVVSDLKMPGMDGIQLLSKVKESYPDTVRLILTGFADVANAVSAVNEGNVFRFLTKPCEIEVLARALADAIKQYRLVRTEKDFLDQTLKGGVKALIGVISLLSPEIMLRSQRVAQIAMGLGAKLINVDTWTLEMAALLSQIGMAVSSVNLERKLAAGETLEGPDLDLLSSYSEAGAGVIRNIPRLEKVAQTIELQEKGMDGSGPPEDLTNLVGVPVESRVLKVSLDFERAVMQKNTPLDALDLLEQAAFRYDPVVLAALAKFVMADMGRLPWPLGLGDLLPGMVLAEDIISSDGVALARAGREINDSLLLILDTNRRKINASKPLKVYLKTH